MIETKYRHIQNGTFRSEKEFFDLEEKFKTSRIKVCCNAKLLYRLFFNPKSSIDDKILIASRLEQCHFNKIRMIRQELVGFIQASDKRRNFRIIKRDYKNEY